MHTTLCKKCYSILICGIDKVILWRTQRILAYQAKQTVALEGSLDFGLDYIISLKIC